MEMNYAEEVKKLEENQESREWFNPQPGQTLVKIVEVGGDYETEFDGRTIQKKRFVVEVNGKEMNWGVSKGVTKASLYGQLLLAGKNMLGLEGKTLTLLVKFDGKKRDYTILEAVKENDPGSSGQ